MTTYIRIRAKNHPMANKEGRVSLSVFKASNALGKKLPVKSMVHHFDENKINNANNNLIICEGDWYHKIMHYRKKALKECGHAHWKKCRFCKKWDDPINLKNHTEYHIAYHNECNNKYSNKIRRFDRGMLFLLPQKKDKIGKFISAYV